MSGSFWRRMRDLRFSICRLPFVAFAVGLLLASALFAAPDAADETKKGETKKGEAKEAGTKSDEDETEIQQAARKIVDGVKLTVIAGEKRQQLERLDQPVLRYGDIPRANDKGSVWIWQRSGRPQAVMELYRGADGRAWVHVIHSLSADAIDGDFGGQGWHWTPPRGAVKWNDLTAAQAPADRPAARTRQIKELAQRFTAHEFWDPNNSRFELRLLVQPVHKYNDPETGLLDGALFLLCHATNPEVALLIEAVKDEGEAKFRYALARLGHAELHVAFDEKEVWRQERVSGTRPSDAYWLLFRGVSP